MDRQIRSSGSTGATNNLRHTLGSGPVGMCALASSGSASSLAMHDGSARTRGGERRRCVGMGGDRDETRNGMP